ncbi:MAG: GntR family transcriptional regulator [Leucobacter sp.]
MASVDPNSPTPPYEQLREHFIAKITTGELAPGTKLLSVRKLANELGLAPNTVARAYRELEVEGFVRTQGRNGTIVAPDLGAPETHRRALALTRDYVSAMTALDIDRAQIDEYLRRV